MSFIDLNDPSDYELLETTPRGNRHETFALIKRTYTYDEKSKGYEIIVPDAGEPSNARILLKMYREREQLSRIAQNDRELEFLESLKSPHNFLRESRNAPECYCGKLKDDEIHVETWNDF